MRINYIYFFVNIVKKEMIKFLNFFFINKVFEDLGCILFIFNKRFISYRNFCGLLF